ncbi:MAG: hypothetical protein AB7J13_07290 [Pyrinomonadaceae bacterium]
MKTIDLSVAGKRALSLCLSAVLVTVYSMVTLATTAPKPVGELVVSGKSNGGVTVNGEPASTGRTVFAASTITTPADSGAVLNMGTAGKIELAPGTTFLIDGDGNIISGSITAGNVTVLNASQPIAVRTLSGETLALNAGETAGANSTATAARQTGPGGLDWAYWALIIGAAVAIPIIIIATNDDDNNPSVVR